MIPKRYRTIINKIVVDKSAVIYGFGERSYRIFLDTIEKYFYSPDIQEFIKFRKEINADPELTKKELFDRLINLIEDDGIFMRSSDHMVDRDIHLNIRYVLQKYLPYYIEKV